MREIPFNSSAAVAYARRWALDRNDLYYDFEHIGGDCTNFVSQCIYAGAHIMNYTPVLGWYFRSISDRTASWSGVEYLYDFLTNNRSAGPYAHSIAEEDVKPGDIVQLANKNGVCYHSSIVTATTPTLLVAAHSFDALDRPLLSYGYASLRFLHLGGVRTW